MYIRLLIIVFITLHTFSATAQGAVGYLFTSKHPLVYEDPVNLWPYSFINEKGEPDGYNIDLLKILITKEFVKIVAFFFTISMFLLLSDHWLATKK